MISGLPVTLNDRNDFNCSAFLGHGLQWPMNEVVNNLDPARDFLHEPRVDKLRARETAEQVLDDCYYADEYNYLHQYLNTLEGAARPSPRTRTTDDILNKISLLADKALDQEVLSALDFPFYDQYIDSIMHKDLKSRVDLATQIDQANRIDLANLVALTNRGDLTNRVNLANRVDRANPADLANRADLASRVSKKVPKSPVTATPGLYSLVEEHLEGYGEIVEEKPRGETRKRRLCRHFVKGFCMRGSSCDFLHDPSIFCCDEQKVFLGGLSLHLTPQILKKKLEDLGLTVLNTPRILRGFSPQVCLGSVEEANKLIAQQYLLLDNQRVDVRRYRDRDELRQVLPSVVKRSVFLGGLKENTTAEMIIRDIQNLDIKVVEQPIVKNGYAPRVVLGSVEGAKMLVSLKRVLVNGTIVEVRPYVNFRKRY